MKSYLVGDAVTYSAEVFLIKGNYRKLEGGGHGYIVQIINDELVYVYNGVRVALVRKEDILVNHSR